MPSLRHVILAAAAALAMPLAAHADSVTLHAERATAGGDNTGARVVDVELKPDSRKALADFTRERVGKRIQLRSNGILLSSATLMSPLEGDSFRITAGEHGFAGKSAEEIAQGIMKDGGLTVDDENTAK
ncbi:SecDF P1 head subdomain-containing protein [Achromobacter sp. AGC78]